MEDRLVPIRRTGFTHSVDVTSGSATGKLASIVLRERFEPGAAEPPPPRWCRACGAVPRNQQGDRDTCGPCGTPLDAPEPGPARVGRVVLVGNRLLPRYALSVAVSVSETGDSVLILDRGDTPVPVAADRFDGLPEVTLPTPAVDSAAGRLWAVATFGMHWGIRVIMGIRFRYQLSGASFAPWLELEKLTGLIKWLGRR